MTESHEPENSYVFDAESASEVARLLQRNAFLKKVMGGPFPERADLDGITRILDIGCGPGGWAVDVATSYPSTEVVGIDISETMLNSARGQARGQGAANVTFLKMDALHSLEFADQHFDLVNMRAAVEYIPREKWQSLLQECYRITRTGGILRLVEADRIAHTNKRAFERYHALYTEMLYHSGYGFSPDGQTLGMSPMLGKLLEHAGYQHTAMKSYVLDLSYDTPFQRDCQLLLRLRFVEVQHQLLERKLMTPQELHSIYFEALNAIDEEAFCGVAYPLIFWGEK